MPLIGTDRDPEGRYDHIPTRPSLGDIALALLALLVVVALLTLAVLAA